MGARLWQIDIAAPILVNALAEDEPLELPEVEEAPAAEAAQ
jgi:hypothetical protein